MLFTYNSKWKQQTCHPFGDARPSHDVPGMRLHRTRCRFLNIRLGGSTHLLFGILFHVTITLISSKTVEHYLEKYSGGLHSWKFRILQGSLLWLTCLGMLVAVLKLKLRIGVVTVNNMHVNRGRSSHSIGFHPRHSTVVWGYFNFTASLNRLQFLKNNVKAN